MGLKDTLVKEVRQLTDSECKKIGIPVNNMGNPRCLIIESGDMLFPVSDGAMNSGGAWIVENGTLQSVEGESIENVSPMTEEYAKQIQWNTVGEQSLVVKFSNGCTVFTSQDPEGNGPGLLFQYDGSNVYEIEVVRK